MNKKIIEELNEIVEKGLSKADLPYKKGNSIRIGKFVIRQRQSSYLIIACTEGSIITETQCLASALAIVKKLNKGQNIIQDVLFYDHLIAKYRNDLLFYKYTINNTNDLDKKNTAEIRYDDTFHKVEHIKQNLDKFIFE